jgi:hypothetical protein
MLGRPSPERDPPAMARIRQWYNLAQEVKVLINRKTSCATRPPESCGAGLKRRQTSIRMGFAAMSKTVGILASPLSRFDRRQPITPDSRKTDGNSVRWLVC